MTKIPASLLIALRFYRVFLLFSFQAFLLIGKLLHKTIMVWKRDRYLIDIFCVSQSWLGLFWHDKL